MISVSFSGLKENIEYGNKAIEMVKKDFPNGFKSNTYYETFSKEQCSSIKKEYTDAIYETRNIVEEKTRQGKSEREATEIAVKKTGAANCGEQSFLVSNRLNNMGIKNKVINMVVYSKKDSYVENGHTFCVIDTEHFIDERHPETWSEDAVVVDMWANKIMQAKEAINYFYSLLKPNPENQRVIFTRVFE